MSGKTSQRSSTGLSRKCNRLLIDFFRQHWYLIWQRSCTGWMGPRFLLEVQSEEESLALSKLTDYCHMEHLLNILKNIDFGDLFSRIRILTAGLWMSQFQNGWAAKSSLHEWEELNQCEYGGSRAWADTLANLSLVGDIQQQMKVIEPEFGILFLDGFSSSGTG